MENNHVEIPCYSLSPRVLTLYTSLEGGYFSEKQISTFENLHDNKNQFNELSQHSVKRLRKAVNFMIYTTTEKQITGRQILTKIQEFTTEYEKGASHGKSVNYKLGFITLTLPSVQVHSDEQIKSQCLNQFLIELNKKFDAKDYIWKAEKQANNNIHFHILINKYIHHAKIKTIWNRIIEKLDYVSAYQLRQQEYFKNGFRLSDNPTDKRTEAQQRQAYEKSKSENWTNPNSTDIHALYKIKNVSAYICKYIAKGVTKTDRTITIQKLKNENDALKKKIDEMQKEICFFSNSDPQAKPIQAQINKFEQKLSDNISALDKLMQSGVSGRIWGQSQSLSKLKNYTAVENWADIPEIDSVIKSAEHKIINDIGSRKVYSYIFDIHKHPRLKANLDFHLQQFVNTN